MQGGIKHSLKIQSLGSISIGFTSVNNYCKKQILNVLLSSETKGQQQTNLHFLMWR